ncbi:MAG TPA: GH92 family glycosyl hydrolase [Candidatus Cybelea sp.]
MHVFAIVFAAMVTTLVDTFVGTSGTQTGGPIDTFPGADVPFGMVQWSPDTPSHNAGGGYEYTDRQITGFSLTHLSGPGCSVFGDFGVLPTTGEISADPANAAQPFSHADEESAPGWYAVSLGNPAIRTELSVTTRTGIGRFTFPAASQANLLFNASSNQVGVTGAHLRIDAPDEVSGSASSGFFCGMPDRYTAYFVARFDRPFRQYGTWQGARASLGSSVSDGPQTGGWVTFDATSSRSVTVKVGLSFVSLAGARANLAAEGRSWNIITVRNRATDRWGTMLRRIAISGGVTDAQRTFYTAFYHTLLHPNVISDVTGFYSGFDGRIHRVRAGHDEYANYSDWDIYRTEVPLIALIAPRQTSDMMQSLVDAFMQEGWLPRWPLVNGPSSVMGGDSIDPVISGAFAFGARDYDAHAALMAMVKGATSTQPPPAQDWYFERWELHDDYLSRGYVVNTHTTSVSPVPNGASETLEYALDDFSIARLAFELRDRPTYDAFMRRSSNWTTLFDGATGWIAPRDEDGAFMQTPLTENGQSGFQEGNAAQYTWMVPQDLRDLTAAMGGVRPATAKLDAFFTELDAGQDKPYAWLGNEPSLGAPWVYLSLGEPWRAQEIVRRALTTLYADAPAGLPGNDDLGTMSAWYLWCAIGLYPQNPAVRYLDVGAPLFSSVRLQSPNGPTIEIRAPQASLADSYVEELRLNGRSHNQSWIDLPARGTVHLDYVLAPSPNPRWAGSPNAGPPSFVQSHLEFAPATPAQLGAAQTSVALAPGAQTPLSFRLSNRAGNAAVDLTWQASLPGGLHLNISRGSETVGAGETRTIPARLSADSSLPEGLYAVRIDASASNRARLEHLELYVRVTRGGNPASMAYATNRFGNDVTPLDLATGYAGPTIPAGEEPRAAVLSSKGDRLYVADAGANAVRVIDTSSGRAVADVRVGNDPFALALEPNGKTLWVVNGDDATIEAIDTAGLRATTTLHVGLAPRGIAVRPDGAMLYVSNSGSNTVTAVDLRTRSVGGEIAVGERPWGMAVSLDGRRLYVVESASNDVMPVDISGTARALAPIRVGVGPVAIAISPDGNLAYVSNHANSTITPIDLRSGTARAALEAGGAPAGVAFTRDGGTAVVLSSRDNTATLIDVATGRVRRTIPLGNGPYGLAAP